MAHALFKVNGKQFASIDLTKPLTIGRSADCDIRIVDTKLSRRHLRLEPGEQGWLAVDLNSSNGTTVEGSSIKRQQLEDGDLIQASPLSIVFHAVRPPTADAGDVSKQIVVDPADLEVDFASASQAEPLPERPPEAIIAEARKSIETVVEARQQQWAELASVQKTTVNKESLKEKLNRMPRAAGLSFVAIAGIALFWATFTLTNWVAR
jgi:pSer/pThr/pTyr-binding forkhead associated (FHA) protein